MKVREIVTITICLMSALALATCGPKPDVEEPEQDAVEDEEPEPKAADDGMQIEGITGTLSQTDVNDVMNYKAMDQWNLCFQHYLETNYFVYGSINLKFLVSSTGKTKEVQLLQSDYGDYDLEKCIVGKSKFLKFPQPKGGATEVTYNFDTDVLDGVKKPMTLHSGKFEKALAPYKDEMTECLGGKDTGYVVTFYAGESMSEEVEDEDGNIKTVTFSKILTLGGYAPEGKDTDPIECLHDAAKYWKIEMDVDGVGKVTLDL